MGVTRTIACVLPVKMALEPSRPHLASSGLPGFQNVSKTSFQIAKDDPEMASKLIPEWSCFHDSITSYFHDSIHPCFHLVRYSCMLPWFHSIIFTWFHSSMPPFGPCLHASLIPFRHISMLPFFNSYLLPWVNSSMLRFYHTVWGLALGLSNFYFYFLV